MSLCNIFLALMDEDVLMKAGLAVICIPLVTFFYRILRQENRLDAFKEEINKDVYGRDVRFLVLSIATAICWLTLVQLPKNMPFLFYDGIIEEEIRPVHAEIVKNQIYPWGLNLNLDDGREFRIRVENTDSFVNMVESGALLMKMSNSADIIVVKDTTTSYFSLRMH